MLATRRSIQRRRQHTRPTVGLSLIVYNNQEDLPRLLATITGTFDHIALVDNDSTDNTISLFEAWCAEHNQPHTIDNYTWHDDFSAKRNHADGLLTTDWIAWLNADDTIQGAHNVRKLAALAPPNINAFAADYDYGTFSIPRERMVRRGAGIWTGRTHDMQLITGGSVTYTDAIRVTHHGSMDHTEKTERDRHIVEAWHRDEPDNQLVTAALAAYGTPKFEPAVKLALEDERLRVSSSSA